MDGRPSAVLRYLQQVGAVSWALISVALLVQFPLYARREWTETRTKSATVRRFQANARRYAELCKKTETRTTNLAYLPGKVVVVVPDSGQVHRVFWQLNAERRAAAPSEVRAVVAVWTATEEKSMTAPLDCLRYGLYLVTVIDVKTGQLTAANHFRSDDYAGEMLMSTPYPDEKLVKWLNRLRMRGTQDRRPPPTKHIPPADRGGAFG